MSAAQPEPGDERSGVGLDVVATPTDGDIARCRATVGELLVDGEEIRAVFATRKGIPTLDAIVVTNARILALGFGAVQKQVAGEDLLGLTIRETRFGELRLVLHVRGDRDAKLGTIAPDDRAAIEREIGALRAVDGPVVDAVRAASPVIWRLTDPDAARTMEPISVPVSRWTRRQSLVGGVLMTAVAVLLVTIVGGSLVWRLPLALALAVEAAKTLRLAIAVLRPVGLHVGPAGIEAVGAGVIPWSAITSCSLVSDDDNGNDGALRIQVLDGDRAAIAAHPWPRRRMRRQLLRHQGVYMCGVMALDTTLDDLAAALEPIGRRTRPARPRPPVP